MADTKVCKTCGVLRPLKEFNKNSEMKDGYENRCKPCKNVRMRQLRLERSKARGQIADVILPDTKICRTCHVEQSLDAFNRLWYTKDGRHTTCKSCTRKKFNTWKQTSHGQAALKRQNKRSKFYRATHRGYRASKEIIASILSQTHCQICGKKFGEREPQIDHSHETGNVRGALCWVCNVMIGNSKDSPEVLRKAAEYLEYYTEKDSGSSTDQAVA